MPENTPQNPNSGKKTRLGRGLGSLLGGALENAAQSSYAPSQHQAPTSSSPTAKNPVVDQEQEKVEAAELTLPTQSSSVTAHLTKHVTDEVATTAKKVEYPAGASAKATKLDSHSIPAKTTPAPQSPPSASAEIKKNDGRPAMSATPATAHVATAAGQSSPSSSTASSRPINEESQIWMIGIDKIKPNTQQPRQVFTPDGLKDLTASVREKGILQPIVARRINEREFEIIAGERRWRAAQMAGLHQVPVILKKVSHQDSLELAIIENIQRENLNPIDEAEAFQHLLTDYSMTQQQVADKMGKERSSIANSLRLLSLPGEVRLMLKSNELSTGHAKVLLGLDDHDRQVEIAQQIINEKLSVRATEKLVAKAKTELRTGTKSDDDEKASAGQKTDLSERLVEALAGELQKLIGSKVAIDYADSKGKIAMHFYSDDQFNQMVEKLRKAWET